MDKDIKLKDLKDLDLDKDISDNNIDTSEKTDDIVHLHLGRPSSKYRPRLGNLLLHRKPAIERYNKKMTFSKGIIFMTSSMFILVLFKVLFFLNVENLMDTTIFATCLTVTGAICGSSLVWYSKKAASENAYKLRIASYEDAIKYRLYFNESMMKLMKKYNITNEEIGIINREGEIDDMMESAIGSVVSKIDDSRDDADSENQLEQFNI